LSAAVILIAAKANAMAKNAAEREINLNHAARIEIAGPLRRQKDDAATFNFDFWPLQYRRGDVFISQSTESRLERNRREGLCERLKSGPESQDLRHSTAATFSLSRSGRGFSARCDRFSSDRACSG
jgi:hypothetical protein